MAIQLEDQPVGELWKSYKTTGTIDLRNELVLKYGWLVKSIVRRVSSVSGSYVETDDLTSYGMIGLIKAVEKYDLSKGVTFETFATYRIRGEIIDFMRRNDWVPRSVRKKVMDLEKATSDLANDLGRQPTDEELTKKLGIKDDDLIKTLSEAERFSLISFEELIYDTVRIDSEFPDEETPEGKLQEDELLEILVRALGELPERERLIITLYYYEELTLKEISSIIGVSESRISQIHSRAIQKMKLTLKSYINS